MHSHFMHSYNSFLHLLLQVLCCRDDAGTLLAAGNADIEGVTCAQCERLIPLQEFAFTCAGLPPGKPFADRVFNQTEKSLQVSLIPQHMFSDAMAVSWPTLLVTLQPLEVE